MAPDDQSSALNAKADPIAAEDFMLPKDVYFSKEVAELERQRLWPRVWQLAGREEDLPNVGSYITYEILDQSVIVVRTAEDKLQAFYNACRHRGRRLVQGSGQMTQFSCLFHGWRYNLDGSIKYVLERGDWVGCPKMTDDDLHLREILLDTWQGWVFINFDKNAKPLADYLAPVNTRCDPFDFKTLRRRWHKTVIVKCNWKVAIESFNEFYHVTGTHAQLQMWQDDISRCEIHGDHGMMRYPQELNRLWGAPATRTGRPFPKDHRKAVVAAVDELERTHKALWSARSVAATHRVMQELPEDAPPEVVLTKMGEYWKEAALAEGAGWPEITPEQAEKAGFDWHVFPNFIFLLSSEGQLAYRVRPNGDDTESTIFDVFSLIRYVPGGEPDVKNEFYENWRDADLGLILNQDFANMEVIHQGMKSWGFEVSRTNPLQESPVANFHRALRRYLGLGKPVISPTA